MRWQRRKGATFFGSDYRTSSRRSSLKIRGGGRRLRTQSNPLNYCERYTLVSEALQEAGLDRKEFGIVPCPIESPSDLTDIVPLNTTCFLTVNDEWGHEKAARLRATGYEVVVLWERVKAMSGSMIREAIRAGDANWKD